MMNHIFSDRSALPFPAELRLDMYRHPVRKTYLALPPRDPYLDEPFTPSAGYVILRVSKATSSEALSSSTKRVYFSPSLTSTAILFAMLYPRIKHDQDSIL